MGLITKLLHILHDPRLPLQTVQTIANVLGELLAGPLDHSGLLRFVDGYPMKKLSFVEALAEWFLPVSSHFLSTYHLSLHIYSIQNMCIFSPSVQTDDL